MQLFAAGAASHVAEPIAAGICPCHMNGHPLLQQRRKPVQNLLKWHSFRWTRATFGTVSDLQIEKDLVS